MQLMLNPNKKKKETQNCQRTTSSWNKQLRTLDVLSSISVTRPVTHFEMSALNAKAYSNAVGVCVNAVAVEPNKKEKKPPKLSENHKFVEQSIEQEDEEVGRTLLHVRHPSRVPL